MEGSLKCEQWLYLERGKQHHAWDDKHDICGLIQVKNVENATVV